MSQLTRQFVDSMCFGLEKRSKKPSTDVWPSPLADLSLGNDFSAPFIIDALYQILCDKEPSEIASAFKYPAKIAYLMYLFFVPSQSKKETQQRALVIEKLLLALSILRNGDPFVTNKFNKMLTDEIAAKDIELCQSIDRNTFKLIRFIISSLSSLTEYNYFAWMGLGREIHGSYINNDTKYLIYDYHDIKLPHWQYSVSIPFNNVRIIIEDSRDFHFDFNGRQYCKGEEELNHLLNAIIIIDGKPIECDLNTLNELLSTLLNILNEARNETKNMTGNELLCKHVLNQYFVVNNIKNILHREDIADFVPNKEMMEELLHTEKRSSFSYCLEQLNGIEDSNERLAIIKSVFDKELYE